MSQDNFVNNAAKSQTRANNLLAAQQSEVLWSPHRQCLIDDWVELAGVECPTLDFLIPHLAPQAKVLGVDRNRETIEECRQVHAGKPADWVCGDLINLVANRDDLLENAGVINFDPWHSPGKPLERALGILGDFARQRQQDASHFLLIVNVTASYKKSPAKTIKWIEEEFPRLLGGGILANDLPRCVYVSKRRPMINVPVGFGFDPNPKG